MSLLVKRAQTWEISESEAESDSEVCIGNASPNPDVASVSQTSDVTVDQGDAHVDPLAISPDEDEEDGDTLLLAPAPAPATPSPGKRRRRTPQEVEADRIRDQSKREARETLRKERAKLKEEKRQEQRRRKAAAEHLKCLRPEHCLKYLTVCIDPAVLQDPGSDGLLGTLDAMEWKSTLEEQLLRNSIAWRRELPPTEEERDPVAEDQVLVVITQSDFLDLVLSLKQSGQGGPREAAPASVFSQLCAFVERDPDKVVTLAMIGPDPQSWTWPRGETRDEKAAGRGGEDMDVEEALVSLQLCYNTEVLFLDSWEELTEHVCAVTKALAKRPFKRLTDGGELPFCAEGSWAAGVRVERDGAGLGQVWTRQIQQLNRVSAAVAGAVSAAHPSPQLLLKAYREAASERDRKGLLADLPVRTGDRERRVGPDVSARLYRHFSTDNPQLVLD
ncbi:essential meiotic structure-specific endonuclease subunit 2 [Amia ocellicauda]|uniref:essential meiotic structure-specific endonuclease subunit 2 n=1 Tax=Amia ocellicauda TaxID=2972642 RepID=UPI00346422D3